jgi:hypothetical protein
MDLFVVFVILLEAILTAKVRRQHPKLYAFRTCQTLLYNICAPRRSASTLNLVRHGDRLLESMVDAVNIKDGDGELS